MATSNPFDLLGDDDNDDPSQLIAAQQQKIVAKKPPAAAAAAVPPAAKLPSKPLPPSQAVREARNNATPGPARGGAGRGGPFSRGRGGRGYGPGPNRELRDGEANGFTRGYGAEDGDGSRNADRGGGGGGGGGGRGGYFGGPRPPYRGGNHSGFGDGEQGSELGRRDSGDLENISGRPPRRVYDRRSGTGRGYEMKRDGAGRGNWGTQADETLVQESTNDIVDEKAPEPEEKHDKEEEPSAEPAKDTKKEVKAEAEQKEVEEDKEMTLDEYVKVREEKRKALVGMKAEERKVELDKEFESMKQLTLKKGTEEVFIKLGPGKDGGKKKENIEKDERSKKAVNINELFVRPADGDRYNGPGGRGGRGRGRGPFRGGFSSGTMGPSPVSTPLIEDPSEFPTLGGRGGGGK